MKLLSAVGLAAALIVLAAVALVLLGVGIVAVGSLVTLGLDLAMAVPDWIRAGWDWWRGEEP